MSEQDELISTLVASIALSAADWRDLADELSEVVKNMHNQARVQEALLRSLSDDGGTSKLHRIPHMHHPQ